MNSMDARGSALSDSYLSIIDAECDSLCKEPEGKHCVCYNKVDMPRLWQTLSISYYSTGLHRTHEPWLVLVLSEFARFLRKYHQN